MGILEDIIAEKRKEIESLKSVPPSLPSSSLPRRDFKSALSSGEIAIIGELKKCSPSAGIIREDFVPEILAKEMEEGGAKALSVLTDNKFFCGSFAYIPLVKQKTNLPILMKDFLIDEFQIELAYKLGADAVLLIARCLTRGEVKRFLEVAREYGMHCLVEIFDEWDWEKIKGMPVEIVGINSRDLRNFHTNFERIIRMRDLLPEDILIVAESGVREREQIERLKEAGIRAVLIGEALMRAKHVKDKLRELMGEC